MKTPMSPPPPSPPPGPPHSPGAPAPSVDRTRLMETIFLAALEKGGEERAAFLAERCGRDAALRAEVEELLAADEAQPNFLRGTAEPFQAEAAGDIIGHFKLREQIGEGGFGTVWVAEQEQPVRRRVALKIIKLGMDTKEVVARFGQEREALALMDHPNIAKVLDAGATAAGRPYFVMELVRGLKITDYCDEKKLSTAERIDLFIMVCQAVQHAHQKGIIHRDLKPSNILVTVNDGKAVPKVIDFGVAKAAQGRLTKATVYTQFQQMIGTPLYMSPEQAELTSLDIDTRSDIYSLGVLLYELLTGHTPIEQETLARMGLDEIRRIIREVDPPRPSLRLKTFDGAEMTNAAQRRNTEPTKLPGTLQGDLDWIVMKCLEKDRGRRYETANSLALDLQRHLKNEVVGARPPTAIYLLGRLVRRNKLAFTASAAVAVALLVGAVVSTWQAVEATKARFAAQDAQSRAEAQQKIAEGQKERADTERQRAQEQLKRAEWLVYAGKLMLAQTDFESGSGGMAKHYLEECAPDLRGWEYRYLRARIDALQTFAGHRGRVLGAAFSPNGRRVITGGEYGTAKIWDVASGQAILELKGLHGSVECVAFSPDGGRVVTGGGEHGSGIIPGEAKLWDAGTGQLVLEFKGHTSRIRCVAFSPDGRQIVTGSEDHTAKVWDAATGGEILTFNGHIGAVRSVSFRPDGQRIVSAGIDEKVRVWDAVTRQEILALPHRAMVAGVAFSPDGKLIATAVGDSTAQIWDAGTGRVIHTLRGHSNWVVSVAFSPDGQRLITGSWDQTTKVWSTETGEEIMTLKGHGGPVYSVAFSRDGQRILTGSDDSTAKLWDGLKGQKTPLVEGHLDAITSIAFSPDSQRLLTSSHNRTVVWDTATSREVLVLKMNPEPAPDGTNAVVWSAVFSPDGRRIATGSQDKTARIWDATTGEEILRLNHAGMVTSVAFSPDGRRLVTGSDDSAATVWDTATGGKVFTLKGHDGLVRAAAFSPDGQRILTASGDGVARVWDGATGQELRAVRAHASPIWGAAFSPDGRQIVTGSEDCTAKVWDTASGAEIFTLKGHTRRVCSVAFSPDGQRIVTGSDDRLAKIWNAATGQEALSLPAQSTTVSAVAFSPDGQRLATGIAGASATVKVWFAPPDAEPGK